MENYAYLCRAMMKEEKQTEVSVGTIGFFDGVHRGHLCLIQQLKAEARERGMKSMLVTFDRHPRTVVSPGHAPTLLTTLEEKEELLRETGVDKIVVLPFTLEMSRLSAREFMEKVLYDELNIHALLLGYDHAFGHGGGAWNDYVQWGKETGIEVVRGHELEEAMVSSSKCRKLLEQGDIDGAREMLGRAYSLSGTVVRGFHVGHELGFPTANLQVSTEKLLPANGVYAVWATLADGERYGGMLNIGNRPTIGNGETVSIEVNLLDYKGDLYGQWMKIEFVARLRKEERFVSRDELKEQLRQDEQATRAILAD